MTLLYYMRRCLSISLARKIGQAFTYTHFLAREIHENLINMIGAGVHA